MFLRSVYRLLCLGSLLSPLVARAAPTVPFLPLTVPATHHIMPGKIVFSMLVTPDLNQAQAFYGRLFGWTFRAAGTDKTERLEILLNTRPIGSMVLHKPDNIKQNPPYWVPFISTSDTATVARETKRRGGHVLFGPRQIPGLGEEVVVGDPRYGIFAALSSEAGDPADKETTPVSDWCWFSLLTPAPQEAAAYLQFLFGYMVSNAPEADSPDHLLVTSQNKERASINTPPQGDERSATARWIQFVKVDNTATTAEQAKALGGTVIIPPHVDRDGAVIAVLGDPEGAIVGIMEEQKDGLERGAAQ